MSLAGKIKCLLTQVTRGHISSGIVVTRRPDLSRYSNNLAFKLGMVFLALSPQAAEALSHFMAAA